MHVLLESWPVWPAVNKSSSAWVTEAGRHPGKPEEILEHGEHRAPVVINKEVPR